MERSTVIGKVVSAESEVQSAAAASPAPIRTEVPTRTQKGFSLLELMIAMFIMIILLSVAVPVYQRTVLHARETVLRENLWQMRRAIDQYATDKGRLPQSVEEMVEAKYLRELPVDPILEKAEWKEITGEDPNSPDGEQGLTDIRSLAEGQDSEGKDYAEY